MHRYILVALVLSSACDRSEPVVSTDPKTAAPTPETKGPEPETKAEAKPETNAEAKPETKAETKPATPAGERFVTADKLVDVPKPTGDGWECLEQTAPEPKTTLAKCRHTDREKFFFMMAKDYVVTPDQTKTAEQIATEVFPTTYAKLFTKHEITSAKKTVVAGREGHELAVTATHSQIGDIAKRELVFVEGEHVFVLSAEGKPDEVAANAPAIDAWFGSTRFLNAPPKG